MSFIENLDNVIKLYFSEFLDSMKFIEYEEYSEDLGALRKFKNDFLRIKIVIDRDFISLDISSIHGAEDFINIAFISGMLEWDSLLRDSLSKKQLKKILVRKMTIRDQAKYLINNWDNIADLFDYRNNIKTSERLDNFTKERAKIIFNL